MDPKYKNQTITTNHNDAQTTPQPMVHSQPPGQQPMQPTVHSQFTEKAWKKVKIGACVLIASCAVGILLLPASYNYSEETLDISASALAAVYIFSTLLQLWLIILGFRLFKKDFAFMVLSSLKRRFLYLVPIAISMLFVTQWNKFANLVAFILLLFACADLKKAGVITSYKQ
jgi:hypothetical protein